MQSETYEQIRGHRPDFIVRYQLFAPDAGGRKVTYQHLRCDFMYHGDDPHTDGISMIHPEFLDQDGMPLDDGIPVALKGQASMWILVPEARAAHRTRLTVGTRGYFMEGSRRVGEVLVEEVVGLHENPV
jgi:hypothetical protein